MTREFEGHSEKDAIDKAVKELGLGPDEDFDVEILESRKGGFLRRGFVRLRIHAGAESQEDVRPRTGADGGERRPHDREDGGGRGDGERRSRRDGGRGEAPRLHGPRRRDGARFDRPPRELEPEGPVEQALVDFGARTLKLMGHENARVSVIHRKGRKKIFTLVSPESPMLIGRKGQTLNALQVLFNCYAEKVSDEPLNIVVDCANYRMRRENSLARLALSAADKARRDRSSVLLEPMNPFDRRLIHIALFNVEDIDTKSEGNGLIKRVRVFFRGGERE